MDNDATEQKLFKVLAVDMFSWENGPIEKSQFDVFINHVFELLRSNILYVDLINIDLSVLKRDYYHVKRSHISTSRDFERMTLVVNYKE